MRARTAAKTAVALCSFLACSVRADGVPYVADFSCGEGPYSLVLPATYPKLKALGPLLGERTVEIDKWDHAERKDLEFDGLALRVITFRDDPTLYMVVLASVSKPTWRITGPFRVGQACRKYRPVFLNEVSISERPYRLEAKAEA